MSLALTAATAGTEIAGETVSRTIFGLVQMISDSAKVKLLLQHILQIWNCKQNVRGNKELVQALTRHINEISNIVINELEAQPALRDIETWQNAMEKFLM